MDNCYRDSSSSSEQAQTEVNAAIADVPIIAVDIKRALRGMKREDGNILYFILFYFIYYNLY